MKTKIPLGKGWATNTVNTVIFRARGLLTLGRYQFAAFYAGKRVLRLVRRDLRSGKISTFDLRGNYSLDDAHNYASLGYDGDGFLHLAYDHHNTGLRYRRSKAPRSIAAWTEELAMTGKHEGRLSYPSFLPMPRNGPLLFLYRDGAAARGALRIKAWSAKRKSWTDRQTPILSGAEQRPWTSSPYWNHPAVGRDGMHHGDRARRSGSGDQSAGGATHDAGVRRNLRVRGGERRRRHDDGCGERGDRVFEARQHAPD